MYAALLGKNVDSKGNSRQLFVYTVWLFAVGFVSTTYTNLLQISVITANVRHTERAFEEMLAENFIFQVLDPEWIKSRNQVDTSLLLNGLEVEGKTEMVHWHKQLAQRVVKYHVPPLFSWQSYFEEFSEGKRKALVLPQGTLEFYKWIPKIMGVDLVMGKELFFRTPFWWSFEHVERGSILQQSVDVFEQAGLISYFLRLHDSKLQKMVAAESCIEFLMSNDSAGHLVSLQAGSTRDSDG